MNTSLDSSQGEVIEAARALLIHLQTDSASLEADTDDGGRLVVEVLYFPPGRKPSRDCLTLLPDVEPHRSATWA